jgi:predicted Rossmann-fold nucleotide-binding protein
VGSSYWNGLVDWIKNTLLAEKNISPEDLDFFVVVDTVDEVMENLNRFYSKDNFKPNF